MQHTRPRYLGIDLGTTNSAAAVFDGEELQIVRAADGGTLTPSVVRIDKQGRVSVGTKARRALDRDPSNTHGEFKRLMGTGAAIHFPAAGLDHSPESLSAELLRSIRNDVEAQLGFCPTRAAISVPALFELPQSTATSEAARIAGFEQVELIQEPVASALAAGWSAEEDGGGSWLVYDMGGGTFDVSLLETRDGLLRVVGHDGDNFLGGRDIDRALVDWALAKLQTSGISIPRDDPEMASALHRLRVAAEEAKIDLTREMSTQLVVPGGLDLRGELIDVEFDVDRNTLQQLIDPIVMRSLDVCSRLLVQHGLTPDQLRKVVLVGGPSVIPHLRTRVGEALATTIRDGLDPMTLVARGAALYAATANLTAQPEEAPTMPSPGRRLWLHYPSMSSDLHPHVAGRVLDGPEIPPAEVRFVRADGEWSSPWTEVSEDDDGVVVMLELAARKPNTFALEGRANGASVPLVPSHITIVQGLTISDPPLSRSVGVALANDRVRTYLERGTPLPAKRTFLHHTVESVAKGEEASVLNIPIVQGELEQAHLCRLVGRLEIGGSALQGPLPAGSEVEVTVEVDRGGRLHAQAMLPALHQVFEQVAHLVVPDAPPETLRLQLDSLKTRLEGCRAMAMRSNDAATQDQLYDVEWSLQDAIQGIASAKGGDEDAAQKTRRTLLEIDAKLSSIEDAAAWPELERRAREQVAWAVSWIETEGTPQERAMVQQAAEAIEVARDQRHSAEVQRQLRVVTQLGSAAFFRHPDAWRISFEHAASTVHEAQDIQEAQRLVARGREALRNNDRAALRGVVNDLWRLLPGSVKDRSLGFGSGLR